MKKFDLLYRSVIDYDESYNPKREKNIDNFSFFVLSLNMAVPTIFSSLQNHISYYYDSGKIINFSVENKEELFKIFEENKSKIINIVIVQEIGTLNVLELIYKSDDIEAYRSIIQEFIDNGQIDELFFKKNDSLFTKSPRS